MKLIKPQDSITDLQLIQLWQDGSTDAFETLYRRYSLNLLAIALDKTRDRELAEELVQDTFISFYNSKVSVGKMTTPMAFLYIILKNKILSLHRRNLVQQRYQNLLKHSYSEADEHTQSLIETRELERLLNTEIEKLPDQCRKVFQLRRQESLSNKQVAEQLLISENTVEQHMRKALRLLRIAFVKHDVLVLLFVLERYL
ncbi:MAG: RNA polymerase sigma-70 factor [Pedobacter sp.]|uniref:RNA polymerase sigma-70 factor n=1 Tax=Pedobacter sp. TaxID=1411316 RepID=UPI0033942D5F